MTPPPIGSRVWIARAACPEIGRPAWSGDATVTATIPCSTCWQNAAYRGRWTAVADIRAAARRCQHPTGYIALTDDGERIPVIDDDPTLVAVPTTADTTAA